MTGKLSDNTIIKGIGGRCNDSIVLLAAEDSGKMTKRTEKRSDIAYAPYAVPFVWWCIQPNIPNAINVFCTSLLRRRGLDTP
jgi:hypothetical protein